MALRLLACWGDVVNPQETDALAQVREALGSSDVRLALVHTFTHGRGVQVYVKTRKIGPLIFPPEGGTLADTLHMLGAMAIEATS